MRNNKVRVRPQRWPEKDKSYPILFVQTKEKKVNNKTQSKENKKPSHSKLRSYAFVYVSHACTISSLVLSTSNNRYLKFLDDKSLQHYESMMPNLIYFHLTRNDK